jgi:hypothetical protein
MSRWLMAGFALMLGALPASAALPPHYQRQAELSQIITEATEMLGIEHPIDSIVMKGVDFYEIQAGPCTLEVQIVDVPRENEEPGFVGPRNFAIETGPVVCP